MQREFPNMHFNAQTITSTIYRSRFLLTLIIALLLLVSSCGKPKPPEYIVNVYEKYFETNILNTDFKVKLATDSGVDLTVKYADYRFKLLKTTNFNGPMTATKVSNNSVVYTGTWSCNDDYSKLIINIPSPASNPSEFKFMNREWRFAKKALPVMEFDPWGTTDPKVLHMERL